MTSEGSKNVEVVSSHHKRLDVMLAGDGSNFVEWKFLVKVNVRGLGKEAHLMNPIQKKTMLQSSTDVAKMKEQRERLFVFGCLSSLDSGYNMIRSQLFANKDVSSLFDVVTTRRIKWGKRHFRGGHGGKGTGGHGGPRVCYNCGAQGHPKNRCSKPLQGQQNYHYQPPSQRQQQQQYQVPSKFANAASQVGNSTTPRTEGHTIIMLDEEFSRYTQFRKSQQPSSSSIATLVKSGNPIACLSSLSHHWVIDSGATDHMTGNSGSGSTFVTLSLPLSSDLLTWKIIGSGSESNGLYLLDEVIAAFPSAGASIAYSSDLSPFQLHCQLGHPSQLVLKKMCPELVSVSSLHRTHSYVRQGQTPYYILSPNQSLFPIPPKVTYVHEKVIIVTHQNWASVLFLVMSHSLSIVLSLLVLLPLCTPRRHGTNATILQPVDTSLDSLLVLTSTSLDSDLDLLIALRKVSLPKTLTEALSHDATTNHWPLYQLDVKNAFLHGEKVYMQQRPGECSKSIHVSAYFYSLGCLGSHSEVFKGTPGKGVVYEDHGHTQVDSFTDADWAGSPDDRKSTTRYCMFVAGNLVSWKSKKQNVAARSSAESEYRAMAQTTCKLMWIHHVLEEIGFADSSPMRLWHDNQAAMHISSNPVFHERTKHIEVDCHFVREKIQQKLIPTSYVSTGEQLANLFTKNLSRVRIDYIVTSWA
ncbi:Uncharacterized protein TCM_001554 [Theobroma cacao]|uniref:CCHC-type domain-containing protein n=1 Tax=Theobroma cacao TaxID=3641 RepID=A0A061DJ38_THECC|nr:Uncharacterized protein TCM_001554 [Theobroma cacao]